MKKLLAMTMTVVLMALAIGCGSNDNTTSGNSTNSGSNDNAAASDVSTESDTPASSTEGQTYDLLIWGPAEGQDWLKVVAERFKEANPNNTYNFEFAMVKEADVRVDLTTDPEISADVFIFLDDAIRDLISAGVIYEVTRNRDDVIARNTQATVDAASIDGTLWAYPLAADNGFFMWYDSSLMNESDMASLDSIIAKCNEINKKFTFDIGVGWLASSFLFAQNDIEYIDGKYYADFNNDNGVAALEAAQAMVNSGAWINGWSDIIEAEIGDTVACGVGGSWMYNVMQERLGDNMAATKMPTATIGGKQVQLSSFSGGKLVGVNSFSKSPGAAMDFADFMTGEAMQTLQYEMRGIGPSNINVANSDAMTGNVALAALSQQSNFAKVQRDIGDAYWTPTEALMNDIKDGTITDFKAALDEYVNQLAE